MALHSGFTFPAPEPGARLGWPRPPRPVRDLMGLPERLAAVGPFELRLATTKKEIRAVQRLRYGVFFEDGDAVPDVYKASLRRDKCPFDRVCDHLYVVDTSVQAVAGKARPLVVGTTRLLRGDVAEAQDGFYSETEFVLEPMLARNPGARLLELGRSCVHPDYRGRRVIDLLWHGVGLYASHHGSTALIGCSSLPGTCGDLLAVPLSYAFHHAAAPARWQAGAVPGCSVRMDRLERGAVDPRDALASLPPLVRAYLRAGGRFASEAAVDHRFGTIDLFTVLPFAEASPRYLAQFGPALARA